MIYKGENTCSVQLVYKVALVMQEYTQSGGVRSVFNFIKIIVSHQWCDLFYRLLHSYTRHIERVVRGERDTFLSARE